MRKTKERAAGRPRALSEEVLLPDDPLRFNGTFHIAAEPHDDPVLGRRLAAGWPRPTDERAALTIFEFDRTSLWKFFDKHPVCRLLHLFARLYLITRPRDGRSKNNTTI